jgi:hypothetical protein
MSNRFTKGKGLFGSIATESLTVNGSTVAGGLELGESDVVDLNGEADALILDADNDTTISSPTDDQIDFELKSVDHVVMKAVAVADAGAVTNIDEIAFSSPVDTTGTNTHNALNIDIEIGNASGGTNEVRAIAIDNTTGDAQVTATAILVGTGFDIGIDMQGTKLELDADNDTSIIASTDDQIDIEISGALDFRLTANTFTALSGSAIATNTIAETTAASGVTIDGVLVKDGTTDAGRRSQELTASGAVTINSGLLLLNHATVIIAATLDAPAVGDELFIVDSSASGTAAHTVTLGAGVTWDGTNNTATLNAPGEALHVIAISATRFFILENIGSVALSSV